MGLLPAGLQAVFSCDTEFQLVLAFGKYLACFDAFTKGRCSESFIGVIVRILHGKSGAVTIFASYILDGQSRLFDSLDAFFPEYEIGRDITVKNLLTMRSGVPDFYNSTDEDENSVSFSDDELPFQVYDESDSYDNQRL